MSGVHRSGGVAVVGGGEGGWRRGGAVEEWGVGSGGRHKKGFAFILYVLLFSYIARVGVPIE